MAHNDASEEYSSPNQFFFYLYDKRNVSMDNGYQPMYSLMFIVIYLDGSLCNDLFFFISRLV